MCAHTHIYKHLFFFLKKNIYIHIWGIVVQDEAEQNMSPPDQLFGVRKTYAGTR